MMRSNFIFIMAALMALCKPGAERVGRSEGSAQKSSLLQKAAVDSVAVIDAEQEGALDVVLTGYLPSPAYEIERVEVKRRGKTIEITPLMRHDPDKIVIMMTIPYSKRVRLEKLRHQAYTVRVNDAQRVHSQQVTPRRRERPEP